MATTNIDAVAEFKVLTNAYQAEYGRAVGGQLQVVTKSGSQRLPRLRLLVRPALGLERQHLDSTSATTPEIAEGQDLAQRLAATPSAGRSSFPGFNADKKKLFFFFSQEFQRRSDPATERQTRVPTALERRGDFSQSVDSSGNPFPYIRDYQHAACRAAPPTRAAASRTAASSAGFPRTASTRPASPP